jgi:hypothetical protein
MTPQPLPDAPRRALPLTGASRGIGHATELLINGGQHV